MGHASTSAEREAPGPDSFCLLLTLSLPESQINPFMTECSLSGAMLPTRKACNISLHVACSSHIQAFLMSVCQICSLLYSLVLQ